jgi:hypothetical protein
MDTARDFVDEHVDYEVDAADAGVGEDNFAIGTDERRMHVRAYNHWVSLLRGRAYPSIDDLDPAGIADFGAHSVLLDFSEGVDNPAIQFLGRALRLECGLDASITHIAEVPSRSLLSRLTDHYLQIIANRSPIGFEAEFVGTRGHTTLYRGILMPFSSDEDTIDYIYGVINWKEMADAATQAGLAAELAATARDGVPAAAATPAWADGPGAARDDLSLADQLSAARESAATALAADTRSRGALYRALSRAHDFGLAADAEPEACRALLAEAGITAQARAPLTPIVKLVFGAGYDKTRVTEFAAVLAHARAQGVGEGELGAMIEAAEGGIKGIVKMARAARRPVPAASPARATLAGRPVLASLALDIEVAAGAPLVLVARGGPNGGLEIIGTIADAGLVRRAVAALG